MKNKNILITITLLALILIGGYVWFVQTEPEIINDQEMSEDMDTMNEDMNMDDNSVMAMDGKFTPEVLYVTAGQEIEVLNHEDYALSLLHEGVEIGPIPAGGVGTFTAPIEAGTHEYRSSFNESIMFNLVVEI